MNCNNLKSAIVLASVIMLCAFSDGIASDNVEWNILKTLQLESTPLDVAITSDGRRIYVLTDQGEIIVYSSTQTVEGKIKVGKHVDQLKLGPRGQTLILTSGLNKTVQIATVDFIQKINIIGSPFKGSDDAPVVIAVFDDFQ